MAIKLEEPHLKLVEAVSADRLMAFAERLSAEVRLSGSEEELRAFQYAKEKMDEFGVETELSFHKGLISLPVEAELTVKGENLACITHSMSASTGEEGINGELLYVKELKGILSSEGKIILTEGIATPGAVEIAEKSGALAAIFINGPWTHEMTISRVWGNPTPETRKEFPLIPVISVAEDEGNRLKTLLEADAEGLDAWLKTVVDTGWRPIPTLVAEIKGEVEPEKFILFSGHIDSWHYGAMDNAGANATMLEVARLIKEQQLPLRRSLRIVFWSGHSHGRYSGSTHYCDSHWEDIHENCLLHVYIDSVGGKGAAILGESNCMAETKKYGGSFVEALTGEKFIGKRFGRGGDQSFWGAGVPALFMGLSEQPLSDDLASRTLVKLFGGVKSGGFGWWWHTTEDTLDKLDKENLRRDCQVYMAVIYDACSRKVMPLNHAEGVRELKSALEGYAEIVGNRLDFRKALERAETLEKLGEQINQIVLETDWPDEDAKSINQQMLEISHQLIPLNYVSGDIYDQDLAMNQPVLPLLKDVILLAETSPGSDTELEWQTILKRRLNKVEYGLLQAIKTARLLVNY